MGACVTINASTAEFRRDTEVIGLIGFAHMTSHFFQLILAPLFPLIKEEFGVSYAALGFMVTVMYSVSAVLQTMAGFVVDRFGARRVLLVGLSASSLALVLAGLATSFWMLLAIAVLAGLGNSVFHPADFSILNAKVDPKRLGYAFSTHGIGGNFGWLAAPPFTIAISSAYGWRTAAIAAGVLGLLIAAFVASRTALFDSREEAGAERGRAPGVRKTTLAEDLRTLTSKPILKCFGFFTFYAMALIGLQTFSVSAATTLYGAPLVTASEALTGYIAGGIIGILAGGFAAARSSRHNLVAAASMASGAALTLLLASGTLPVWLLIGVMTAVGFCTFSAQPSRDILVRAVTPPGATGKVYGFVYSGLDLGGSTSPLLFGWLLDQHLPQWVFGVSALFMLAAMATVVTLRPRRAADEPAPGVVAEKSPS